MGTIKQKIQFALNWEPKSGREKPLKAFARILEQKARKKKGGKHHGL